MGRFTFNIEKLYQNDPNLQKCDIDVLKKWAINQPHYPEIEEILLLFTYYCCKYNVEATKKSLDNYLTLKTRNLKLFGAMLDKELIQETMKVSFFMELPKLTPDNNVIIMAKLFDFDARNFNLQHQVQLGHQIALFHLFRDGFVNGVIIFADLKGASYSHILRLSIPILKDALNMLQDTIPINIVGIHVINSFGIAEKFVNLIRFFLKSELLNKIYFHSSMSTVDEFFPRECLPEEYGGKLPTCKQLQEQNFENMMERWDLIELSDSVKIDESKKPNNQRRWFF